FWLKRRILRKGSHGNSTDRSTTEEEKGVQTLLSTKDNSKEQVTHTNRPKRKYDECYLTFGYTSDAPVAVRI
ncbi:hypothetical protein NPIL_428511, partial [Nephila pilipes]